MRVFFATLLTAGVALADGAIPPGGIPPRFKHIPVVNTVRLDAAVKGYTFFARTTGEKAFTVEPKLFEVGTEKGVVVPETGGNPTKLYAVPNDLVPTLKTVKDWNDAILLAPKQGIVITTFEARERIDGQDAEKRIEKVFVIKSIDPKKGIVVEEVKDEKKPAEKKDKPITAELGVWVGGLAAAVSITLGGLWLVRRKK